MHLSMGSMLLPRAYGVETYSLNEWHCPPSSCFVGSHAAVKMESRINGGPREQPYIHPVALTCAEEYREHETALKR